MIDVLIAFLTAPRDDCRLLFLDINFCSCLETGTLNHLHKGKPLVCSFENTKKGVHGSQRSSRTGS